MKKKSIIISIAVLMMFMIFGLHYFKQANLGDNTLKKVNIIIEVDKDIILNEQYDTNVATLKDLLIELKTQEEIKLEYEDSQYGMYIKGLGKDVIYSESVSDGLYWVYESENNKSCLENDFCPAASSLEINDGDIFIFKLNA